MKRIIFVLCIICLTDAMLSPIATAVSVEPGYDGYTYVYKVYTDPAVGPWIEFSTLFQSQYSRTQLTTMFKGFPSQTVGKSDIYFMPDSHVTAIVYYNNAGFSTTVLLIPDNITTRPTGELL